MDEQEKKTLERTRIEAKARCHTLASQMSRIRDMLADVKGTYDRWNRVFEKADRELAEEEKLQVITGKEKLAKPSEVNLLLALSPEQIRDLAKQLKDEIGK